MAAMLSLSPAMQIGVTMPKKRGAASVKGFADAEERFLQRSVDAVRAHINLSTVRCVLIAGPGFMRDKLRERLLSDTATPEGVEWSRHKEQIISAPASSAYLQAIPVCSAPDTLWRSSGLHGHVGRGLKIE
jgi:protein pelota